MANLHYVKPERISIQGHPELSERWVQDLIAEDPSILGLGDLILKDRERMQPRAGRLDILLQDPETYRRYEVEIQLGKTDESHIIRTLEYWDIERKRYPQYDHVAVIVAEDITSRFLNVINLFNGFIPLVAIQMNAIRIGDQISVLFTTVLDEMPLGLVEEDEEVGEVTDRAYWINRATKTTVKIVDQLYELVQTIDPKVNLNYTKFYIGLSADNRPCNFVLFRPRKRELVFELRLDRSEQLDDLLNASGLSFDYNARRNRYRIWVSEGATDINKDLFVDLLKQAHAQYYN